MDWQKLKIHIILKNDLGTTGNKEKYGAKNGLRCVRGVTDMLNEKI